MRNPIVIIGGMGPQASLRFHQLLIEKSKQHHNGAGDEYPFIVHFSLPVADFISDESQRDAAVEKLKQISDIVQALQPSAIALACNTAHLLIPQVEFLQSATFLSMLEMVSQHLSAKGVRSVGLLASPTTIRTKLYEDMLTERGITTFVPNNRQQLQMTSAIRSVIVGNPDAAHAKTLANIATRLLDKGADAILLGCTELPLIFPAKNPGKPVFDCLDLYADAVIARYYLYINDISSATRQGQASFALSPSLGYNGA